MNKDLKKKLAELEAQMNAPDFWTDKEKAQATVKEYEELKADVAGIGKYDKGSAIITVFGGAGGTDAEDFARMLVHMYWKYADGKKWTYSTLHENKNDHGGFRNITFEVIGTGVYGTLKNESGVHRLVRISPFNANKKRHTSFAMVEVIPKFKKTDIAVDIPEQDLDIQFTKSGGPGGQNVNKRETAVRIVHIPTDIAVHADSERSQVQNRERALEILKGKLYHRREEELQKVERGMQVSATTDAEWGNQIRSYVLHPYKMVKDHRTNVEVRDVEKVLEDGDIEAFVEAERNI